MPKPNNVGVGTAILIFNQAGEILLLKRKGSHRAGHWSVPGGWIDLEDAHTGLAVAREAFEETGLKVTTVLEHGHTSELHEEIQVRTITLYFHALEWEGTPTIREPEKCEEMGWFSPDTLPEPLFPGLREKIEEAFDFESWPKVDEREI